MATVTVRTGRPGRAVGLVLVAMDGTTLAFPRTPPRITSSHAAKYGTIERSGKKDVTRRTGYGLRKLSFKQTVAAEDYRASIESVVRNFDTVSGWGIPVRFNGGSPGFEQRCWWTIKGFSVDVLARALNNEISRAELSWDLEEYVAPVVDLARMVSPAPPRTGAKRPVPTRTVTVGSGDTLYSIAARTLRNGARWPEIYALNKAKVPNPNRIYVGQVLRVP